MTIPKCLDCRFFEESPVISWGECRRRAPRPWNSGNQAEPDRYANWPRVAEDAWCGEFDPAPEDA